MSVMQVRTDHTSVVGDESWELRVQGPVMEESGGAVASWAAAVLGQWVAGWDCLPAPTALVVATQAVAPAGRISAELGITGPCATIVGSHAQGAFELARSISADADAAGVLDGQGDDGPVLVVALDPITSSHDARTDPCAWELAAALV